MIWILQNQAIVPAGRYALLLEELGRPHRIVRVGEPGDLPTLEDGDGVIVLGGTMGVHEIELYPWMPPLRRLMADAAVREIPLLGICLGAQLLASGLGGTVSAERCAERGILPVYLTLEGESDLLFSGIPSPFYAQQWHNDSFDLPSGATCLATSPLCPIQTFRYKNAYALQFHPEVDNATLSGWSALLPEPGNYLFEFDIARQTWQQAWDRILINFLCLC